MAARPALCARLGTLGGFFLSAAIPTWEAAEGTLRPVTDLRKHGGHNGIERKTSDILPAGWKHIHPANNPAYHMPISSAVIKAFD